MKTTIKSTFLFFISISLASCSLVGLDVHKDYEYQANVIDPKINKSAWQLLKDRSYGSPTDTIFRRMMDAIIYSEIDTNLYKNPAQSFILLHNDAVVRRASGNVTADCYWGRYKVANQPANAWSNYSKEQVKNWLLYLIIKGEYTFENLSPNNTIVNTFLPKNADPANPESIMTLLVVNDRDSKLSINNFTGSARVNTVRTGGIICTNGPAHVVDRVVEYGIK